MPEATAPNPQSDAEQLEAATDQAIAACGGNAREAVKALLVANEFMESQISEGLRARREAWPVQYLHGLITVERDT